ncbi:MAG: D-cysteine desulfhydrase family protein [Tenuifilaceae bacterium]|jgi:D-cysteine desulfhydrase|nr:D-cysteine desulfhydrase family protein [Tenuifilaceae bacterium]
MNKAIQVFESISKHSLSNLYTPIEQCKRITKDYPKSPRLFIKRDDFIGQLVWGNKLRKLEYSIAEAIAQGADTIITCGAVQSNHARITAQVCKRIGLDCILVQNGEKPKEATGNHKVNLMLNVPIHYVSSREERDSKMNNVYNNLIRSGKKPYLIPLGASNAVGCLGFVNAARELKQQQAEMGIEFDYIIHSTSSGGTQAGLEIGKRLYGLDKIQIIGVSADNSFDQLAQSISSCAEPVLQRLGNPFAIDKSELTVDTNFVGPGYGIASKESAEAIKLFSEHEGILLDNTYTAKAAAGVLDYIAKGKIDVSKNILFWHTGGILSEL